MLNFQYPTTVISVRGKKRDELLADPAFVYVGRDVRFTGWKNQGFGNPFTDVELFQFWLLAGMGESDWPDPKNTQRRSYFTAMARRLPELRGKTLGCWCCAWEPEQPFTTACHAIVLAAAADEFGERLKEELESREAKREATHP